ncbi:hypothetical protein GMA11_04340 [Granulicatella sp. zg-ZJ]|uniref:hypothetical protein n=1 Tax=Granulicatella sp. zg-ZJ TaxID=2678504 RepID=UPI0013D36E77|nr:hypothetical protein [Granulicatella sp. zg-ZJ]NEW62618.1 hypothetical protein [Granulicatella sp. zg-ZJ]
MLTKEELNGIVSRLDETKFIVEMNKHMVDSLTYIFLKNKEVFANLSQQVMETQYEQLTKIVDVLDNIALCLSDMYDNDRLNQHRQNKRL